MVTGRDLDPFVHFGRSGHGGGLFAWEAGKPGTRYNSDLKTFRSFLNRTFLGLRRFRGFNAGY